MSESAEPPRDLHGWKEIAKYLQVSVRGAQNLEKQRGLPVHRGVGPKAPVYAVVAEIEEWRIQESAPSAPEMPEPAGAVAVEKSVVAKETPRKTFLSRRALLFGGAGAALCAAPLFLLRKGKAVQASLEGDTVCARDEVGQVVWRYRFPEPLYHPQQSGWGVGKIPGRLVQMVDFGEGAKHVLVAAQFAIPGSEPFFREELYCFSPDGKIRWRYQPELTVAFGDAQYSGPWNFGDLIVAPDATGKEHAWLAMNTWNWRPGVVLRISKTGAAALQFVNAGNIYALHHVTTSTGRYIVAGGVNNEYETASVAILNVKDPPSSSPQTAGSAFECTGGPKGSPEKYFLFPPMELIPASRQPYNGTLLLDSSEFLTVVVVELRPNLAHAHYVFSPALEPISYALDDSFASFHEQYHQQGLLKHSLAKCPYMKGPMAARRWDPHSGWKAVTIPFKAGVNPGFYRG